MKQQSLRKRAELDGDLNELTRRRRKQVQLSAEFRIDLVDGQPLAPEFPHMPELAQTMEVETDFTDFGEGGRRDQPLAGPTADEVFTDAESAADVAH